MERKDIYYSIHNAGDGSASLVLVESEKLAEWDQEYDLVNGDPHWAEPSYGRIPVFGNNIQVLEPVYSKESYFLEIILEPYIEDAIFNSFVETFYKEGFPNVEIVEISERGKDFNLYKIAVGNRVFDYKSCKDVDTLQKYIDNILI